jgi:hypothetical protein
MYEAVTERVIDVCKCLPYFVTFDIKGLVLPSCKGLSLACATYYVDNLGNDEIGLNMALNDRNELKICLQRCDVQIEKYIVTSSEYPNWNTFENRDDLCLVAQKILKICKNAKKREFFLHFYLVEQPSSFLPPDLCGLTKAQMEVGICINGTVINPDMEVDARLHKFLYHYAVNNLSKVKIFFSQPYYTQMVRDIKMTVISFIGNTGGLMGLSIGLSFVSIAEIFYHCTSFLIKLR